MIRQRLNQIIHVIVVLALVAVISSPVEAAEAPYRILHYDIDIELNKDGTATFSETVCYEVTRDIHEFSFQIPYDKNQKLSIERVAVADTVTAIDQAIFIEVSLAEPKETSARAMTYTKKDESTHLSLLLHLFSRAGSYRTINMRYTLSPSVEQHQDAAVFQHTFFQGVKKQPIENTTISFHLPGEASEVWCLPSSLTAFESLQPEPDKLLFRGSDFDVAYPVYLTCLLPDALFSASPEASQPLTWDELAAEALKQDENLHQEYEWYHRAYHGIFILIALAAILFILVYWFFDREGAIPDRQPYLRTVPHACPPAVLALLMKKRRFDRLILATLFDLTQRGYLAYNENTFSRCPVDANMERELMVFEACLLDWFFNDLAAGGSLTIAQIRRNARDEKTAENFRLRYHQFRTVLARTLPETKLMDERKTAHGRLAAFLAAAAYALLAALLSVLLQTYVALFLLVPAIIFLIYAFGIRRLTNRGRVRYAEGQAFERYLRRINHLPPFPDAASQQQFVPYAIALGLHQRYLNVLPLLWCGKPVHDELECFNIKKGINKPLKEQVMALAGDLRTMESMLSASLLFAERVHR
jgi:uncharacterized membrane protein